MPSSLNCERNGEKGARIFAHTTRVTKLLNAFTIHARILTHTMVYSFFLIKILDVWDKCHIYSESKTWKGWHVIKRLLACALIHSLYGYNVVYTPFLNTEKKEKRKRFSCHISRLKKLDVRVLGFPSDRQRTRSAREKNDILSFFASLPLVWLSRGVRVCSLDYLKKICMVLNLKIKVFLFLSLLCIICICPRAERDLKN